MPVLSCLNCFVSHLSMIYKHDNAYLILGSMNDIYDIPMMGLFYHGMKSLYCSVDDDMPRTLLYGYHSIKYNEDIPIVVVVVAAVADTVAVVAGASEVKQPIEVCPYYSMMGCLHLNFRVSISIDKCIPIKRLYYDRK